MSKKTAAATVRFVQEQSKIVTTKSAKGILKVGTRLLSGGTVCRLDVNELCVDGSYQRTLVKQHAAKFTGENYDPVAANPLKVNIRDDGHLFVFDGQHGLWAAIQTGLQEIDAIVFNGMNDQQESSYFYVHNNVPLRMNGWVKFYADLKAGNMTKAMIVEIVHSHNLTLPRDNNVAKMSNADITSPVALTKAMERGVLDRMCKVIDKVWRYSEDDTVYAESKSLDFLRGFIEFLCLPEVQKMSDTELIATMRKATPAEIRGFANGKESKGRIDVAQLRQAMMDLLKENGPKPKGGSSGRKDKKAAPLPLAA